MLEWDMSDYRKERGRDRYLGKTFHMNYSIAILIFCPSSLLSLKDILKEEEGLFCIENSVLIMKGVE